MVAHAQSAADLDRIDGEPAAALEEQAEGSIDPIAALQEEVESLRAALGSMQRDREQLATGLARLELRVEERTGDLERSGREARAEHGPLREASQELTEELESSVSSLSGRISFNRYGGLVLLVVVVVAIGFAVVIVSGTVLGKVAAFRLRYDQFLRTQASQLDQISGQVDRLVEQRQARPPDDGPRDESTDRENEPEAPMPPSPDEPAPGANKANGEGLS